MNAQLAMITPRRDPEILLRRYWDAPDAPLVSAGLGFLSLGYRVALAARERVYAWHLLSTGRLPCPVVSVGNITLGGSGKTPMVEQVVRGLLELGARPAVVSRGYGRTTRGVAIVADRDGPRLAPRDAGDEPALLADRLPGVPVVVGENRFDAGKAAIERCGATAIVLDDGFQHRTLRKDLELVVVNGRAPWGNQRLFPRGMLREPLSALGRADAVVVTNPASAADVTAAVEVIRRHKPAVPVLTARYEIIGVREMASGADVSPDDLRGRRLLGFAGLASPRGFADTLTAAGVDLAELVEYPDHHWFTPVDLVELVRQSRAVDAEGLVTTEKDAIRLRGLDLPSVRLCVVQVRLQIETGRDRLLEALGHTLVAAARRS